MNKSNYIYNRFKFIFFYFIYFKNIIINFKYLKPLFKNKKSIINI